MNGVVIESQLTLREACDADAVIVGSGVLTRQVVADPALMAELQLDPARQFIGAQCSGTLVLAKLGLLGNIPACTDLTTKPWVEEAGVRVLNQPFFAEGRVATAGGCLASQYLAAWLIANLVDVESARGALHYVAPVGEKEEYRRLTSMALGLAARCPAWERRPRSSRRRATVAVAAQIASRARPVPRADGAGRIEQRARRDVR
jgi:transcriptional regulator GlxA family with amidase domain